MRFRLHGAFYVALCGIVAGCAGARTGAADDTAIRAYIECNLLASRAVAAQAGDPISLAVAAMGLCSKEKIAVRQSLLSTHSALVAEAMMQRADRVQIEENTAEIVRTRARRGAVGTAPASN